MADTRGCDDPNLPKKKSTFKITSVTKSTRIGSGELQADADGEVDSMDDLDESHTEDFSSEILDSSKATDIDQDAVLTPEEIFTKDNRPADAGSRFRVVKIETKEPFRRGRWLCHDFLDTQPPAEKVESKHTDDINIHSGSNSANSSIHYVHGVDDPSRNPLAAGALGTVQHYSDVRPGNFSPKPGETFKPIHPAPQASQAPAMPVTAIPPQRQTSGIDPLGQSQNQNIPSGSQGLGQSQGNPQMQQQMHTSGASQQVPQAQTSTAPSIPQTVMATNVQTPLHRHQSMNQAVNLYTNQGVVQGGQMGVRTMSTNHMSSGPHGMPPKSVESLPPQKLNFQGMSVDPLNQGQGGPGAMVQQVSPNPMGQPHYGQVNQPVVHSINANASSQQTLPNHIPNTDSQSESVHSQVTEGGQGNHQVTHGQDGSTARPGSIPLNNDESSMSSTDQSREQGGDMSASQTLLSPLAAAVGSMTQPADEIKDDRD